MSSNFGPSFNSAIFNSSAFNSNNYLTRYDADLLYLSVTNPSIQYLTGVTPGTATASKALIVDSSVNIKGINKLMLGNSTDNSTNRFISALDSTIANGSTRTITFGQAYSTYNQAELSFYYSSSGSSSNRLDLGLYGNSQILSLLPSGYVGIGKNNPSYKLDVNGIINTNSTIRSSGNSSTSNPCLEFSDGVLTFAINYNSSVFNYIFIGTYTSHNLSLRVNNAEKLLCKSTGVDVTGQFYASTSVQTPHLIVGQYDDTTRAICCLTGMSNGSKKYITIGDSASSLNQGEISFYYSSSYSASNRFELGLYGTGPIMWMNGSAYVYNYYNTTTWNTTSDIRLKENIEDADLDICYNNIKNLRLVRYKWKDFVYSDKPEYINYDKNRLGWIAQELEPILPCSVSESKLYDIDDCKTINTDQIYATLYGCVRKLIFDKEILEQEIIELKNRINNIEELLKDAEISHV